MELLETPLTAPLVLWKPLKNYEDRYDISSNGEIVSNSISTNSYVGLELKPFKSREGYLRLQLSKDGVRYKYFVHRLVAETFIPNPDPKSKTQVNHKDGNPMNNSVNNLEWVTHGENQRHARNLGLFKGYTLKGFKLSFDDVRAIRVKLQEGAKQRQLATQYRVNQSTISRIARLERRTILGESYGS